MRAKISAPVTEIRQADWVRSVRTARPPATTDEYLQTWETFFDHYAAIVLQWRERNAGYHSALASLARFYIPPGARVLEIGSGTGDLLAATEPTHGVGIDISGGMTRLAAARHPHLQFRQMAAERLDLGGETFDYVVLSDLVGFLYDIRLVFERLRSVCHPQTRIVIHWYNRLWEPLLLLAEKLGAKYPQPLLNWTTFDDIANLLSLADCEIVRRDRHTLLPAHVPLATAFANRYLAHLPLVRHLCLSNWVIARPVGLARPGVPPSVSIVCPCRNEAGNVQRIVDRLPSFDGGAELVFVEGHSSDDTLAECRRVAAAAPGGNIRVLVQQGRGKGDAVRLGFLEATGDVLMILDADLSVAPEDLPIFYRALVDGKGEFINGSRLVYAMDPDAMRFLNLLGNRFFALLLSVLIGQPIKDSLCGTKVLWRTKYEELARRRSYFGELDPFGDFDLLFGAAKLNLRIVEVPVRYRQRTYGSTNISRFSDGWLLLRMCALAARKLFFVS